MSIYSDFAYNYNKGSFKQKYRDKCLKSFYFTTYDSELRIIASETLKHFKNGNETGGTLHGLITRSGECVIMLATPPGKKAYHSKFRFQMDLEFLQKIDKHLKDNYKLDHLGDWHSHLIDLASPSTDDIGNTHEISNKNDYDRYIQFIITIHNNGRKKNIKFNSYIYIDAKHDLPHSCIMNVLPGTSPIRLALERYGDIPELSEKLAYNDQKYTILPSAPKTVSSPDASLLPLEETLDKRIEKHLLKLPPEVLFRVEVEINQGVTIATVPIPSSNYCLYLAYTEENPGEISYVYFGQSGENSLVEVTSKALKNGPYTHIKTIWSRFMRIVGLKHKIGK